MSDTGGIDQAMAAPDVPHPAPPADVAAVAPISAVPTGPISADLAEPISAVLAELEDGRAEPGAGSDEPEAYDPFDFLPAFLGKPLREIKSRWVFLIGLALVPVLVVITMAEGSFGSARDFRPIDDSASLFGRSAPYSPPEFPLIRDLSSVLLLLLVVTGYMLLHRQWMQIAQGLSALREYGTITPRVEAKSNWMSRTLRIDGLMRHGNAATALERLDARFGTVSTRTRVTVATIVLASAVVLEWFLYREITANLFRQFVPAGLSPADQHDWLLKARHNWWADWHHPIGATFFLLTTYLGVVLIVAANLVGVINIYFMVALYFAAEPGVDWYNRDGRYGWTPVARIFRTVYWALIMLGASVAMMVIFMGADRPISWISLIALYVPLMPIYLFIPYLVFRRVEEIAKTKRRAELNRIMAAETIVDIERMQLFVAEFDRCNMARIRPMRLATAQRGAFATVVLLPILLTILQIYGPMNLV